MTPIPYTLIPRAIQNKMTDKNSDLRDDLSLLKDAEAKGWSVIFKNNDWRQLAVFKKNKFTVSRTKDGWCRFKEKNNGYSEKPIVFGRSRADLEEALELSCKTAEGERNAGRN